MDKKILFDGRFLSLSHAGIGRYSCELLKELLYLDAKQKYILTIIPGTEIEKDLSRALNERDNPVEIVEIAARHYSLAEQTKYLKLLNELKPDLVHFPHFNHPILYKGKFVVTIHDLTLSQYAERGNLFKRKAYYYVISHAAKAAVKVLTVSDFVRRDLISNFDLPPNKVITAYNGIDAKFKKITNPKTLKKVEKYKLFKPYILSVGQWRSHKNLLKLVDAFNEIQKLPEWKGKIELVFAGRFDPKYPELPQKVAELNLQKAVKFTGFVEDEDLPIIYNNATVFVFPSYSEGFGLPGLEAQACGVPVVSSNKTSLPEILGDGALYFNPENVKNMTEKILAVLTDRKLRNNLIKAGEENAKKFSWKKTAEKTLEIYQEILYK